MDCGEGIRSFTDLRVWQSAHQLTLHVYRMTSTFPREERFGLISQMRRAAVSVPANVAEGFKRRGQRDKAHFYNVAQSSLEELRYYFILSRDLGYCRAGNESARCDQIARMLQALINSVRGTKSDTHE